MLGEILTGGPVRISFALQRAFQEIVPPPHHREPLTWREAPITISFLVPYLFMGYLVRREGTHLIRLLLLPTIVAMALRCTFGFYVLGEGWASFEWGRGVYVYDDDNDTSDFLKLGLLALTVIAKSIDFAWVKNGRFKIGEKRLRGRPGEPERRTKEEGGQLDSGVIPAAVRDALEVSLSLTGIGWDYGRGVYIPASTRPKERTAFLKSVSSDLWKELLILDFVDSTIKLIPGIGSPEGGSIFRPNLSLVPRLVLSTTVHILTGNFIIMGLEGSYDIFALIGVGLLGQSPSEWPGFMDHPWKSQSLHELWAKRWHQCLRQVFMIYGGYAGQWAAGKLGMVLCTFLASGLYHELATYAIGRPTDHRVTLFFFLQGVGVVCELVWKKLTGSRVGGWGGKFWMFVFMLLVGQMCSTFSTCSFQCIRNLIFESGSRCMGYQGDRRINDYSHFHEPDTALLVSRSATYRELFRA